MICGKGTLLPRIIRDFQTPPRRTCLVSSWVTSVIYGGWFQTSESTGRDPEEVRRPGVRGRCSVWWWVSSPRRPSVTEGLRKCYVSLLRDRVKRVRRLEETTSCYRYVWLSEFFVQRVCSTVKRGFGRRIPRPDLWSVVKFLVGGASHEEVTWSKGSVHVSNSWSLQSIRGRRIP